jgi:signal transduction histidine kinase
MKKAAAADLAKELHDSVCQTLTGAHLHLHVLARRLKKTAPDCAAEVEELEKLIARARTELQEIVKKFPQ